MVGHRSSSWAPLSGLTAEVIAEDVGAQGRKNGGQHIGEQPLHKNVREKRRRKEDSVGRKVVSQEKRAHSLLGKKERRKNKGVVKEAENTEIDMRFIQNEAVHDL